MRYTMIEIRVHKHGEKEVARDLFMETIDTGDVPLTPERALDHLSHQYVMPVHFQYVADDSHEERLVFRGVMSKCPECSGVNEYDTVFTVIPQETIAEAMKRLVNDHRDLIPEELR